MEGIYRYKFIIYLFSVIVLVTLARPSAVESSERQHKSDDCPPVVQKGKEVPQKAIYNTDDKRSFGKPGNESRRVKKKMCEIDLNIYPVNAPGHQRDCADILARGVNISGIYGIYPGGKGNPFNVFCDMETDGGGWTIFQRRMDGSVNFNRNWSDYQHGFGSVSSEHWLGNDKIHRLTNQTVYELRVDLEAFDRRSSYATYRGFNVGDEGENYKLIVKSYSGSAGRSLMFHSGNSFSTPDHDHDGHPSIHCAKQYQAGWWFRNCMYCNLNGIYFSKNKSFSPRRTFGLVWGSWLGSGYSMKSTEMKVRPES